MSSQRLTDLMQSTAAESDIKFFFVTNTGTIDEASEDLKYSFQIIADFASTTDNLQWLSEADCIHFDATTLTKDNVFVFEKFQGEAFNHLASSKAIVIGPRVLINCQSSNDVVPNISSPIYTLAMKDVIVCVSGIDVDKRTEIHKLVGYMGGLSSKDLIETTTHLITNTIKSPKYEKAAMKGMKIMKEDWIFETWNLSKIDDDTYTTEEFFQKHKVPIFHNLVITSTGIPEADKGEIMKLINDNGGTYTGSFKSRVTDILITQPNQKNSDKFKAAVKCRKECLMVEWVKDSVSKGYSLPYVNYRIYTGHSTRGNVLNSTQIANKSIRTDIFNPDASQMSAIMSDYSVAETTSAMTPRKSSPKRSDYKATLNSIDVGLVKNAKGCLDGCTIWLCGFKGPDIDKLKKIINIGGGTRIDEHGPDVEYAIVGKPNSAELSNLQSLENSNIVTVDWLVACISAKRIVDAKEFLFKLQTSNSESIQTVPSPASRKNIEDMNPFRRPNYVPRMLNMNDDNDEQVKNRNEKTLLEQYSQPQIPQVHTVHVQQQHQQTTTSNTDTADESEQVDENLFRGLTFALFAFSEESTFDMSSEIEELGGRTVAVNDFSTVVDYLIVPSDTYEISACKYKAKEIVTDLFFQDCLGANKIVEIQYYHRAILIKPDCKPLANLNIVFSTYTTTERDYLYSLAQALGSKVNDRYMRNEKPILICPTPDGKKYLGAIKWKLPVVTSDWLRKCLELEAKVPMQNYAVGESKWEDEENVNSATDENDTSAKFVKPMPTVENDENGSDKPPDEDIAKESRAEFATPLVTPAQHPRISSIKNTGNRRLFDSPQLNTQPEGSKTPISEFVEDLTPVRRKVIYDMLKQIDENESPLTKRRRLENATTSPLNPRATDPPDVFEIIDRNYIEMPAERASTPFVEYRKRMFRNWLGPNYDGTPLRAPLSTSTSEQECGPPKLQLSANESPLASPKVNHQTTPQPQVSINVDEGDSSSKEGDKKGGDGSTQVLEFFNSIKKCRDSRPSRTMTQQISKCKINDPSSDNEEEEERPNDPPHQVEIIDWRDPEDFFQSERFLNGSRSTFKGPMRFSMSLAIDAEFKEKIEKLGGTVCEESSAFDPSCTHLICSIPNQSEKTLSIIASGRWLLCPAYVEDSFTAGHFLNEEDYEWGNPKAKSKLNVELDAKSNNIAKVSHKWRTELQLKSKQENRPVGIFSGFRVILHSNKKESFKRLLEAGCGVVVDLKEPYAQQKDFEGVTHCVVDKRIGSLSPSDKAAMIKAGVNVVTILYLQACVQADKLPSVADYAVK